MTIELTALEHWNNHISRAISNVSKDSFPHELESALRQLVDFDFCMVFSYAQEEEAAALYNNVEPELAQVMIDDYLAGPYLLDPFYNAVVTGKRTGFGAMSTLAPDHFTKSEFYQHHYVRTGIADEIGLFFPVAQNKTAVLSVTRQKPRQKFSDTERATLATAAPFIQTFATEHWNQQKSLTDQSVRKASIEHLFEEFGAGVVTPREKEIIALILKGHSSVSISYLLEISSGTVKIHRKNAYDKLKISSQAELFSLFLANLEKSLSA